MTQTTRNSLFGFAIGFIGGMGDYFLLIALNVQMYIGDRDVTFWVVFFFAMNFGALGFFIARLAAQKKDLSTQSRVIASQLDEIEETQTELVASQKLAAIGRVAASVAHEVRNPLGVIKSSADLVLEDVEDPDSTTALNYIKSEVDRLDTFVTELLAFSKPLSDLRTDYDVKAWLGELEVALSGHENVRLERSEVETDIGYFSPTLLTQLTLALVQNGLEHGESVDVNVEFDSRTLRVRVADDGPGISRENREMIFEPFFTTRAKGTGLGLATAQKIAEAHRGTLRYVEGDGATFLFEMRL